MKSGILTRVVPVVLAIAMSACGGGSDSGGSSTPTTPTGPSTVTTTPSGPATASCTTSVTGMPASVPGAAGRYTLTLTTGAGCTWSAQSDASWASVAPASGQGSAAPVVTVAENTDVINTRSANLTIGGQVIHFSQANGCTYTIDRTTADVAADASRVEIKLTTRDGCAWTASSTETWMRPQPSSGSGGTTVILEVAANTGGVRHATATIAGQRAVITQQGR